MKHVSLAVIFVFVFSATVYGQPFGGPGERPFERIEQFKKVRLIEMLEMKEEQSVRFFARMNEHESRKRTLLQEKRDILDKVDRLVRNNADAKEFDKVFAEIADIDGRITAEDRQFFDGLSDILTPLQRGKLVLFERRFEQELREAMRDVQRRRHRGMQEP